MKVELLAITPDAGLLIAKAAGVCRASEPEEGIVGRLIEKGHLSVLEHGVATFRISGISRACSHQLVRHRLASYSQQSQRYVEMYDEEYVTPASIASNPSADGPFRFAVKQAFGVYSTLLNLGIAPEDARFVLPGACMTELVMTANFREWLHIFSVRITPEAQWEIRQVCALMVGILSHEVPEVFVAMAGGGV